MNKPKFNTANLTDYIKETFKRESFSELNRKQKRKTVRQGVSKFRHEGRKSHSRKPNPFKPAPHRNTPGFVFYKVTKTEEGRTFTKLRRS